MVNELTNVDISILAFACSSCNMEQLFFLFFAVTAEHTLETDPGIIKTFITY